ncbi:MAG: alcohol dehydrogenase catalytic domain-containing protein [Candidatus Omnitrophica bacterium]|nr:alcohol dehydrogenase catalytic domain-containing protein [Candidatus Omnitrophota bacterium]
MKAAILEEAGKVVVREIPKPEVDDDSALVKIEAVAICGSDIRIINSGNPRVKPPAIIGHEAAGTIVETGKNVKKFKAGDKVAIGADVPCGECDWCRNGLGNNCDVNYAVGYQIPGAFAEYMLLPKLLLDLGPVTKFEGISFGEAALAEPLACAINGLELVNLSLGKSVVIIGMGPIGCMMIDLARKMGAGKVFAIQRSKWRLDFSRKWEADYYFQLSEKNDEMLGKIKELTDGKGPDIVMTTCPSVEAHEMAIEMVAHRGYVNLFGGLGKGTRNLNIPSNTIHYKECFVTGSHGSVPRQHRIAVNMITSGEVRVKELITHTFPFEDIKTGIETFTSKEAMKVIIKP